MTALNVSPQSRYLGWGVLSSALSLGNWKLDIGKDGCLPTMPGIILGSALVAPAIVLSLRVDAERAVPPGCR